MPLIERSHVYNPDGEIVVYFDMTAADKVAEVVIRNSTPRQVGLILRQRSNGRVWNARVPERAATHIADVANEHRINLPGAGQGGVQLTYDPVQEDYVGLDIIPVST